MAHQRRYPHYRSVRRKHFMHEQVGLSEAMPNLLGVMGVAHGWGSLALTTKLPFRLLYVGHALDQPIDEHPQARWQLALLRIQHAHRQ